MSGDSWINARQCKIIVAVITVIYVLYMGNLLFFKGRTVGLSYQYNWIPFETIRPLLLEREKYITEAWIKNLFGNIVLFIPLGVCIPVLFRKCRSFLKLTVIVILIIFEVELTQLVTRVGTFDVDDIILNTLGAWIGYVGLRILVHVERLRQPSI
ncbi:glycopeptide antibiotics resistance protein [Paenibacillus amylolyticus]|uniref:Glycopeptide antibiotics resistance protein n=1 Tax=Paenibacillus amylolyticus TaxID=1451 RepID=A0AAP5LQS6_PAEAM|nr:VanZ family protein [Paenibacillus amylolyticus]MDR6723739.1 glycopeptide antibiotics resistance protein [Paenibacillus amylolyticus]